MLFRSGRRQEGGDVLLGPRDFGHFWRFFKAKPGGKRDFLDGMDFLVQEGPGDFGHFQRFFKAKTGGKRDFLDGMYFWVQEISDISRNFSRRNQVEKEHFRP